MKTFGLVGRNISYSFSRDYFKEKFQKEGLKEVDYLNFDLKDISGFNSLFQVYDIGGLNVTTPYKEEILSYLHDLDITAKEIGAVNCIGLSKGKMTGYNTDAPAFRDSLIPHLEAAHKRALILGSGGASKAAAYALTQLGIPFQKVSRRGKLTYADLNREIVENHQIIVNCTPLGTFPHIAEAPEIPYNYLSSEHLLYDMVYNPSETRFLKLGKERGSQIKNGSEMLILQAERSWEIWNASL